MDEYTKTILNGIKKNIDKASITNWEDVNNKPFWEKTTTTNITLFKGGNDVWYNYCALYESVTPLLQQAPEQIKVINGDEEIVYYLDYKNGNYGDNNYALEYCHESLDEWITTTEGFLLTLQLPFKASEVSIDIGTEILNVPLLNQLIFSPNENDIPVLTENFSVDNPESLPSSFNLIVNDLTVEYTLLSDPNNIMYSGSNGSLLAISGALYIAWPGLNIPNSATMVLGSDEVELSLEYNLTEDDSKTNSFEWMAEGPSDPIYITFDPENPPETINAVIDDNNIDYSFSHINDYGDYYLEYLYSNDDYLRLYLDSFNDSSIIYEINLGSYADEPPRRLFDNIVLSYTAINTEIKQLDKKFVPIQESVKPIITTINDNGDLLWNREYQLDIIGDTYFTIENSTSQYPEEINMYLYSNGNFNITFSQPIYWGDDDTSSAQLSVYSGCVYEISIKKFTSPLNGTYLLGVFRIAVERFNAS